MIQSFVDWILYTILGLNAGSHTIQSLHFFIYDSLKILLLLFVMISIIGFFRTYISQKKLRAWLAHSRFGLGHILASAFGAVTPFCSCSSIPIFLSFLEMGIPLGITFSFLITSPLVNEYLVVLMFAFFGWKITLAYVISGMLIGIFAGIILGKMNLEKHLVKDLTTSRSKMQQEIRYDGLKKRALYGFHEACTIVKKLWAWILVGVGVGAIIHNYIPQSAIESVIAQGGVFTIPLAVLLGIPLYGNCIAIVPIALALFEKGVPIGTALAFMMATAALSLPEAIILRRAMKLKLIAIFFGIVAAGIIISGYLFNVLQHILL